MGKEVEKMSFIPYPKQTVLWLLSGVPLDPSYEHTVNFLTKTEQEQAFMAFSIKRSYSAQSYQRAGLGVIRIAELADNIYRYNYLMFKNNEDSSISPKFGDKWFYGFIEDVVYINDHTCEVHYSIDVMQTYMFDYALGMCYVEREHSETDGYGQHITDEGLPVGDVMIQGTTERTHNILTSQSGVWKIYIYYVANEKKIGSATQDSNYPYALLPNEPQESPVSDGDRARWTTGNMVGYTWTYLDAVFYDSVGRDTAALNLSKMIKKLIEISATIVSIEIVPSSWITFTEIEEGTAFIDSQGAAYTPKNKKLYTYPYRFINVSNHQGDVVTYRWEDSTPPSWSNVYPMKFDLVTDICYQPQYTEIMRPDPRYYTKPTLESSVICHNTNLVSWSEDSYAKWWAQNGTAYVMGIVGQGINTAVSIIGTAMGFSYASALTSSAAAGTSVRQYISSQHQQDRATINGISAGTGVVQNVLGDVATYRTHKDTPDSLGGSVSQSAVLNSIGEFGFTIYDMGLRARDAKIIDDFFSKYGYAVKRVKLPNIEASVANLRPHWNYIKTKGCTLSSEYLPASASRIIEQVYDKGITFWKQFSEVGNYNLDNSPV